MKRIKFKYRDEMSRGNWREQSCTVSSLAECINIYGLNEPDVDYEIISIEDV